MRIRERNFMDSEFFAGYQAVGHLSTFMMAALGLFPGMALAAAPISMWAVAIFMMLGAVAGGMVPNLGRFYAGQGVPYDLKDELRLYFYLPSEDRALYPAGIVETMKDPDLTHTQVNDLHCAMKGVRLEIMERNKARRALSKQTPDISEVVEQLREARSSVAIETNTYKEFL